jgi:hypothetical protein
MLSTILLAGFGFLLLLTLIGLALILGFRRGAKTGAPRVLSGILLFGGTLVLGVLATVFTAALLAVTVATKIVEHGPVRSIEIVRTADPADPAANVLEDLLQAGLDPRYPVHVLVEYRGDYDSARLTRWLDRKTDGDVELVDESPVEGSSGRVTRLDFGVRISRRDLTQLERDFEREVPLLDFPQGFRMRFRDAAIASF